MKKILVIALACLTASPALAQATVDPHVLTIYTAEHFPFHFVRPDGSVAKNLIAGFGGTREANAVFEVSSFCAGREEEAIAAMGPLPEQALATVGRSLVLRDIRCIQVILANPDASPDILKGYRVELVQH